MYPCFQGNISNVSLLFPFIRPHKVVHMMIKALLVYEVLYKSSYENYFIIVLLKSSIETLTIASVKQLSSQKLTNIFLSPVPPTITLHPIPVVTNEMGSAELSCNATSIVDITFYWEKFNNNNGTWGPIPSSTSLTGMNTMTIGSINIQQSDEGSYRCTASNSAGTSISDVATITVYGEL